MSDRIERLRGSLEEPLLVTNPTNVFYLTGFKSTNPALLVEPERAVLYTDFRYAEAARAIEGVEFVETKRALLRDLAERLSGPIAVEADFITWSGYRTLADGGLDVVPRSGLVEALRVVKDERELDSLRHACAIADRVFEQLADERFVGRTEREVAWRIEELFHEHGGESLAFDIIVAAGPNGARPHARATNERIETRQTVVVDAGCSVDGYFSDYTRTYATGPLDDRLKEAYTVCLQAQQAGLQAVRAGVTGVDADAAARRIVDESDFAGTFGHGLGHGLGLNVHEAPRLATESTDTLAAGNVVTVEPGVYVPGRLGVRIEDLVVVTEDGCDVLSSTTKDLIVVD